MVISLVRARASNDIGFLNSKNRMNVSITRARLGQIIIGNSPTFSFSKSWSKFITDYSVSESKDSMIFEELTKTTLGPIGTVLREKIGLRITGEDLISIPIDEDDHDDDPISEDEEE